MRSGVAHAMTPGNATQPEAARDWLHVDHASPAHAVTSRWQPPTTTGPWPRCSGGGRTVPRFGQRRAPEQLPGQPGPRLIATGHELAALGGQHSAEWSGDDGSQAGPGCPTCRRRVAPAPRSWYAHTVTTIPVLGDGMAGPWFRVASLTAPRPAGSAEQDFIGILPAALAAASRGRPFVAGWLSRGAGSPLELITNAAAAEPAHPAPPPPGFPDPDGRALLYPPGSRGVPARPGWLAAWDSLVWVLCPGRQAPPLAGPAPRPAAPEPAQPTLFESALAALTGLPFGWLVVAEPTDLLDAEIAELRTHVNVLRRHDEEQSRFGAERTQRRLAELDAFREAGLWEVRVLAGAATQADAALLAPVLAGSVDLSHHPYRLTTGKAPYRLAEALRARAADPLGESRAPFPATAGLLAALTGLPRLEVPGLRVVDAGHFDLTSETGDATGDAAGAAEPPGRAGPAGRARAAGALRLGMILDGLDRPVGEFTVPLPTLNRHALVTGATGAGKSQTVRHLLEQLAAAGLPWLVIEPVKSEYPAVAGRLAGLAGPAGAAEPGPGAAVTVISPADPAAIPFSVNPLAPEPGYPVQAHIDMVRALFLAAFDADEPFPQIMAQALQRVYEECGWDVVTGGRVPGATAGPVIPTLAQLQRAALAVIEEVGYGAQLQADVRGFVDVRLRSLRIGSAGRFFEGGHPGDVAALLGRNVVLAIEDVANDEDKAILIGNGHRWWAVRARSAELVALWPGSASVEWPAGRSGTASGRARLAPGPGSPLSCGRAAPPSAVARSPPCHPALAAAVTRSTCG